MKTLGNEQATNTQIFPEIPHYNLTFVYRDTSFERVATRDRALVYAYTPTNASSKTIFIAMEIGPSRSTWHPWEASVITWPRGGQMPDAIQLDSREVQLLGNPPLIGKYFAFELTKSNTTQVVLYWQESALFNTGSSSVLKYVKISLIVFPKNEDGVVESENLLLPFAEAIVDYWQPIKIWSQISLNMAQNGGFLTIIPVTLLAIILTAQIVQRQREKKSNLRIYNQLHTEEEKHILKAVQGASKKGRSTTGAIASEYQKLTGTNIETKQLIRTLEQAEELKLVERDIASVEDQPFMVWKSQIQLQRNLFQKFTSKANKVFGVVESPINRLHRKIRV